MHTPTANCSTWPPCHLQADKGDLLPTNLGGFGATTTGGSGGAAAAGGGLATAGSVGPPTKIKLKVGGKKDKKVRLLVVFCTQAEEADIVGWRTVGHPLVPFFLAADAHDLRQFVRDDHTSYSALPALAAAARGLGAGRLRVLLSRR